MGDNEGRGEPGDFREIPAREFVRRFRRGVAHDQKSYAWLLGAGCSVSSGVPGAAECARAWIKELKYLETGQDQDVEAWAARRFVGFDPLNPAAVYADVMSALFHTETDRRRALERLLSAAEPGFGYATLAQLMTHAKWGERSWLTLSVNFDDLLADALHVYSQRRPQTVAQEALTASTPLFPATPTVLKLHGDAHLPPNEETANRPRFREEVRERLRELLTEAGLVIVGYGGREQSILDMLEGLPVNGPSGGVFWVNEDAPRGAFGDWLRRVGAVWVRQSDFDELMYYVRVEFGLGHPKIDRFERVFRRYNAQYRELSTRSGLSLPGTPSSDGGEAEPQAIRTPRRIAPGGDDASSGATENAGDGIGLGPLGVQATRRETDHSRRERLRQSLTAYSKALHNAARAAPERARDFRRGASDVNDLLDAAVIELHGGGDEADGPDPRNEDGPSRRPSRHDLETVLGNGDGASTDDQGARRTQDAGTNGAARAQDVGSVLAELSRDSEMAIPPREGDDAGPPLRSQTARAAAAAGPQKVSAPADQPATADAKARQLAQMGKMLAAGRRWSEGGAATALAPSPASLPPEPHRRLPVSQASFGEAAFAAALEAAPDDPAVRTRFARFLAVGVGDLRRAEEAFEEAQQLAPENVSVLRDYARFSMDLLRDMARAEALLAQALRCDLRNAETLRLLAEFLSRAHGDFDEAENCLRLAIEVQPGAPRNHIAYAQFLLERRGRRDEAEAQLRRASEARPESAAALAELALFRAAVTQEIDAAQQILARASRIAPGDAEVSFARAAIAERKGDLDDAEAHYRRAVDGAPAEIRPRIAFAEFLRARRGDLDAAERTLREAVEIAPHRAGPSTALGRFLAISREDPAAAEKALRSAVGAEPFDADALSALAEHLALDPEQWDEVEDLFRDALALAPRSSAILRAYGRFLGERRGDAEAAEAQLRAAVELDPQDVENHDALAQFLHVVRQDAEEAEVYFREALKLAPNRGETLNRFAGFLRATKRDLDEAEAYYRRALEANPRDAHSLARSAQFLLSKGQRPEGLKVLNDAFDAAWRMDPAVRPASLMLELWIYRYAHDPARREESLRAAIALIEAGVRCEGWDLRPTVKQAVSSGHPDPDILHDLAAVAAEGLDPARVLRHGD